MPQKDLLDRLFAEQCFEQDKKWLQKRPPFSARVIRIIGKTGEIIFEFTGLDRIIAGFGQIFAWAMAEAEKIKFVDDHADQADLAKYCRDARKLVRGGTFAGAAEGALTGAIGWFGIPISVVSSFSLHLLVATKIRSAFRLPPDPLFSLGCVATALAGTAEEKREAVAECLSCSSDASSTSTHTAARGGAKVLFGGAEYAAKYANASFWRKAAAEMNGDGDGLAMQKLLLRVLRSLRLDNLKIPAPVIGSVTGATFSSLAAHKTLKTSFHLSRLDALHTFGGFEVPL